MYILYRDLIYDYNILLKYIFFRLLLNIAFALFIYYTPKLLSLNGYGYTSIYYYPLLIFLSSIQQVS